MDTSVRRCNACLAQVCCLLRVQMSKTRLLSATRHVRRQIQLTVHLAACLQTHSIPGQAAITEFNTLVAEDASIKMDLLDANRPDLWPEQCKLAWAVHHAAAVALEEEMCLGGHWVEASVFASCRLRFSGAWLQAIPSFELVEESQRGRPVSALAPVPVAEEEDDPHRHAPVEHVEAVPCYLEVLLKQRVHEHEGRVVRPHAERRCHVIGRPDRFHILRLEDEVTETGRVTGHPLVRGVEHVGAVVARHAVAFGRRGAPTVGWVHLAKCNRKTAGQLKLTLGREQLAK